ncbi:MAG: DNA replication/repair protein RecF [Ignavibacteria bacterium]|nr:DNA replication/repair protein RecF [Ignavibacteria bacterium]
MRVTSLRLRNFRNHTDSHFEFGEGTNVLLGDNGHGKTNVIEAISYLCLTKSFYTRADSLAVMFGQDVFEIDGVLIADQGHVYRIRIAYQQSTGEKLFSINQQHTEPLSCVIGKFPIVISSPEHAPITSEGPVERRRFVDFVISQSSPIYFETLLEYRRVLKQRNKILLDAKLSKRDPGPLLLPWDEQLVRYGSYLMMRRGKFIEEFQQFISSAYHQLVGREEEPTIEYLPVSRIDETRSEEGFQTLLQTQLRAKGVEEKRTGSTLVGPHRDEFLLKINGRELRKFASQGQHKTFLVALKIGEFFYLKDRCQETPIMLLDDIFSELDEHRAKRLLSLVGELSQTFITSTNPHYFDDTMAFEDRNKIFHIQEGNSVAQNTFAA